MGTISSWLKGGSSLLSYGQFTLAVERFHINTSRCLLGMECTVMKSISMMKSRSTMYVYMYNERRTDPTLYSLFSANAFARALACFSRFCTTASAPMPPNTRPMPSHWPADNECPNQNTLNSMVSILRVTVTVTSSRDEKRESV